MIALFTDQSWLPESRSVRSENSRGYDDYRTIIENHDLDRRLDSILRNWRIYDQGDFVENLYDIPHDALIVMGIYGHETIKEMLWGNTAENVQSTFPNSLLLTGPELKRNY